MKQGKKPTVAQMKRIEKYKLKPENWLVVKDCREVFLIRHKVSGNEKNLINHKKVD